MKLKSSLWFFCKKKNFSCNEGDMNKLYREEMLQVVIEVRDKYLQDYLEVVEINFKYDFLQYI